MILHHLGGPNTVPRIPRRGKPKAPRGRCGGRSGDWSKASARSGDMQAASLYKLKRQGAGFCPHRL